MTTTDILFFARTKHDTHAHTHILTLRGVQTVCTCNTARHCVPKLKGANQTNGDSEDLCEMSCHFSKGARNTWPVLRSATIKTQDFEDGCGAAMIF